jgi:hypothetical protein
MVFVELSNFPLEGVDLEHCVDDVRWLGSKVIFLSRGLIWGTV